ncbi:hypothetical protein DIPPA_19922 [Diplonema papillatum]|nr:hypothetical protein DIPPA_19922 [Diplonema papillatum]
MDADTSEPADELGVLVRRIDFLHNEMFRAMDGGFFHDWVEKYLSDDVHFVIAGKTDDLSEDRVCCGKMAFLTFYNTIIESVHSGSAMMEWKMLGGVEPLSPNTARVGWEILTNLPDKTNFTAHIRRLYTLSPGHDVITYILTSALTPEADMNRWLVRVRTCVPPSAAGLTRPCAHNSWDSVRSKKNSTLLCCRTCATPWKLPCGQAHRFRCADFVSGSCPTPAGSCRRLHIHLKKRRLHERKPHIIPLQMSPLCANSQAATKTTQACNGNVSLPVARSPESSTPLLKAAAGFKFE